MKNNLQEQLHRIKEMMDISEDFDSLSDKMESENKDRDIPRFEIDEQVGPNTQTPKVNDRIGNIVNIMNSLTPKTVQVIKSNNPKLNGMSWGEYVRTYKITMQEIAQANQIRNAAISGSTANQIRNAAISGSTTQTQVKPVISGTTTQTQVKPVISGTTTQTQVNPVISGSTSQTTPIGTGTLS